MSARSPFLKQGGRWRALLAWAHGLAPLRAARGASYCRRVNAHASAPRLAAVGVTVHGNAAVLVTVASGGGLLDRRRVALTDAGLPTHPHHHEGSWAVGRYLNTPGARSISLADAVTLVKRVHHIYNVNIVLFNKLDALTTSEVSTFCDCAASLEGGYGHVVTCDGGSVLKTAADRAACVASTAKIKSSCAITVADSLGCASDLQACNFASTRCQSFISCFAVDGGM